MERIRPYYLSFDDIEKLSKHELGHGTDGAVYRLGNGELIKIYHTRFKEIKKQLVLDDSDMKIYTPSTVKRNKFIEPINYFKYEDNEDIRLRSKDAIFEAIKRQESITRSNLPKNVVYLNGAFAGCVLTETKGIQIHKLGFLPLKYKKAIVEEILLSIQELMDNYIYHVDLSNSPYAKRLFVNNDGVTESLGHSHILVNPFTLKPNIIDLDGKSTVYMEHESEKHREQCLYNLCILMIEFLLGIDTEEFKDEYDMESYLAAALKDAGVKNEFIDGLSSYSLSLEESFDFVKSLKR